jgi:transcription antitermination factor NusA-like protein
MIKNSLEWQAQRRDLAEKVSSVPYSPDLKRMLKNIDDLVTELSKIEVDARRTKSNTKVNIHLNKISAAINTLEQWIFMAALEL